MLAEAIIQVVVFVVTTGFWLGLTFGAGGLCATSCDWAGGQHAALLIFGIALGSFVLTAIATLISSRTGRDLAWVPLVASVLIVVGYFPSAELFTRAMS